ncbi:hypothetical protein Ancab_036204 [Ancistrocladus abbreviatus]
MKFNRTAAKHIRNVAVHYFSTPRVIFRLKQIVLPTALNDSLSLMAEETPIRFGILGCADIARKLSRAIKLAPNAAIYAIGSRSVQKAREYAESNGYPPSTKIYGSYEEVLDDPDVDAVYIPLPTVLHLRYAVLAAEKKKHVLLEKPVAPSVAELDKILEACEANGVQFMDCTMWMHHPRTAKMKEFLSDPQRFGDLQIAKMNIDADSGHAVSESHYTEQPPAKTSSIKGRSKVRVGKSKPAKVKPTMEIGEDDRLTGITIGDSGIQNMNRLIINGLEDLSAADIWAVGKTLGDEASGDESEVIKHLKAMEDRDQLQWVHETSR